jgi:hypothetical protein
MSDGKFPVLDQHHRCGYHGRQLGRSGVTRACLPRKENSVRPSSNQVSFGRRRVISPAQPCGVFVVGTRVARPGYDFAGWFR